MTLPDEENPSVAAPDATPRKPLSPAAERALAEAAARRAATERANGGNTQPEIGGPEGPEPTRYGDWEKGGLISDF
ncbi:DUF1674 domain-containing protein [Hyphomicrobium sp.]|uniref:DUF1674 domain-containing protein n=1 Tax=Hyphomicrobium sp. TaxID=82 RepID=UPI0025C15B0E|nr:DUF1674 domain-containing protein [Hyphomicrobium sp.]MCC7252764.1 DUF1674 domain-containing protein [Hyphomicrobium sp.]